MKGRLPDQYLDALRQVVSDEDNSIFATCKFMADSWVELSLVLIKSKAEEEGWTEQEAPRKTHAWFIETCAAECGMHPTSMYDRMRVGRNVVHRNYHLGKWSNLAYGHWCALMRNIEQDEQGIIPEAVLLDRLDWVSQVADENQGQPPSVRDIQSQFRQNGEKKEWELYWNAVVRNAKQIVKIDGSVPARVNQIAEWLLSSAGVGSTGGGPTK